MRKILAVDDDTDFLEELGMALELFGYKVVVNPDPIKAIEQARTLRPYCILFDLKMPQKHGFQFFEELKEDVSLRSIPAIAMSSFSGEGYDSYLSIFGIKRFLKKPFTPQDAVDMINLVVK